MPALSSDVRALRRLPASRDRALLDGGRRVRVPRVFRRVRHVRARAATPDGHARAELLPVHAVQGSVPDQIRAQSALRYESRQRAPDVPVQQLRGRVPAAFPDGNRVYRPPAERPLLREVAAAATAAAAAANQPGESSRADLLTPTTSMTRFTLLFSARPPTKDVEVPGMSRHVQHAIRHGTTFGQSFQTVSMSVLFGSVPHRVLVGQTHTDAPQFDGKPLCSTYGATLLIVPSGPVGHVRERVY